ncbi:MAG: DUF418 domain-containing protein [Planctomycetota bacterium]|nr:DUF418 domain-containing protein [Planctomycetota bacterium]MDP6761469.1 DUF418 domain-containing protein [Planctomycetota bacterium]MDP6989431.1 DUF418 domain-containing protein [Planctomycetota bacterium]
MPRGRRTSSAGALGAAVFCGAAGAFAALWGRFFRRGPLEWLMRRVCGGPRRLTRRPRPRTVSP